MTVNDTNLVLNTVKDSFSKLNISSDQITSQTINMGLLNINSITNSTILLQKLDDNSKELLTSSLSAIINISQVFINDDKIVVNLYNSLDNILKLSDFSSVNESSKNIFNESQYNQMNFITNELNMQYLNNIVSGDAKIIETSSFQINFAKLSNSISNVGNFSIGSESTDPIEKSSLDNKNIHQYNDKCSDLSSFCLNLNEMNKMFKSINKEGDLNGIAIVAQHNKKNIVPLGLNEKQFIFSQDSLNFSFYEYPLENTSHNTRKILNSHKKLRLRRLDIYNPHIYKEEYKTEMNYVVRLKMKESIYKNPPKLFKSNNSDLSDSDRLIEDTSCVQFNENNKLMGSSCETWYDYVNGFIICKCSLPGLTLNLWDDSISEFSKLTQFPSIDFKISDY